jgi:hypothetical protein
LVTFDFNGEQDREMFFEVLKSLNFTSRILPNVWITSGSVSCPDAKSIYNLLSRYINPYDVVFVSQLAMPVTMETLHGNFSMQKLRDLILV